MFGVTAKIAAEMYLETDEEGRFVMSTWNAGGVSLPDGPYMIGAGVCKTPAAALNWLRMAPVVTGSYTPEARAGNSGRLMWPDTLGELLEKGYGLNSYGMPNPGEAVAADDLRAMDSPNPLIANIAGFSECDYYSGIADLQRVDLVAAFELNFGCPNTQGEHAEIMSFDTGTVDKLLKTLTRNKNLTDKPIWLKFSPYSNPAELKRMAMIVNEYAHDMTLAVVTCNTFPNAYAGPAKITPNHGLAGLSGPAMRPIALGQVMQFREHLDPAIDVIGVGGITAGDDIIDFIEAGASAVQIVSLAHWAGDPRSFHRRLTDEATSGRLIELLNSGN